MFPHGFTLQATWRQGNRRMRSERWWSRGLESTRSSMEHVRNILSKWTQSKGLTSNTWRLENRSIIIKRRSRDCDQTASSGAAWNSLARQILISSRSPSDGGEDSWKNSTIAVRSNRDRGAIEPRSWVFRRGIISIGSDSDRLSSGIMIDTRSWPDRGPIVGSCEAKLKLNWGRIHHNFGSYKATPRNLSHDASNPPPRPIQSPRSSGQFPSLKACISLLCSSTFDRLVKKLSEFRGRS